MTDPTPTALEAIGRDGLPVGRAELGRFGVWRVRAGADGGLCGDRWAAEAWLLAHGATLVREEQRR